MLGKNGRKGSMRMHLLKPAMAVVTAMIVTTAWAELGEDNWGDCGQLWSRRYYHADYVIWHIKVLCHRDCWLE